MTATRPGIMEFTHCQRGYKDVTIIVECPRPHTLDLYYIAYVPGWKHQDYIITDDLTKAVETARKTIREKRTQRDGSNT